MAQPHQISMVIAFGLEKANAVPNGTVLALRDVGS
jgi:hypothetical protein